MPSHHLPEEVLIAARGSWQRVLDKLNRNFKEGCPFQRTKRQLFSKTYEQPKIFYLLKSMKELVILKTNKRIFAYFYSV